MTTIIRDRSEAGDAPCIDFSVYVTPKDKTTVCGYHNFQYQSAPDAATFVKSPYGVPVAEAFEATKAYAEANNIPFIFIDDPDEHFEGAA